MPTNLPNQQQGQQSTPVNNQQVQSTNGQQNSAQKAPIKQNPQTAPPQQQATQTTGAPNNQKKEAEGSDINAKNLDIGKFITGIVENALNKKASDIHIEPSSKKIIVRLRIDGILQKVLETDKQISQSMIFKIKIMSKLRTDEHFAPQDGRIRFHLDDKGRHVDTRVSILPTTHGEKVVMRLLSQEGKSFALKDLGYSGKELDLLEKAYNKPYGTILTVGPTGSGKTTSLYAILKILNTPDRNITTVEDPVEYTIDGVNHIQINKKANLTFASGLRSILRQDPDVVMVGEIRDEETARIATNAAMTGHLVLSTLHTNDSVTTIPRLADMGIEPFLVASTVNLIIAQRLARRLCDKCKVKFQVTQDHLNGLKKIRPDIASLLKLGEVLYKEQTCPDCTEGFKGRIGLYEVLPITKAIRNAIVVDTNADKIYEVARKEGLVLIVEDGIKKLREGIVSISELVRVTALKE